MSDYFIAALRKRRVIGVTVRPHPHPNVWNCERCVRERGRERERERERDTCTSRLYTEGGAELVKP